MDILGLYTKTIKCQNTYGLETERTKKDLQIATLAEPCLTNENVVRSIVKPSIFPMTAAAVRVTDITVNITLSNT